MHDEMQRRLLDLWLEVQRILDVRGRGRTRLRKVDAPAVRKLLPSINQGLRDATHAVLPKSRPLLQVPGWQDIEVVSLTVLGVAYCDAPSVPWLDRLKTKEVRVELKFRGQ